MEQQEDQLHLKYLQFKIKAMAYSRLEFKLNCLRMQKYGMTLKFLGVFKEILFKLGLTV